MSASGSVGWELRPLAASRPSSGIAVAYSPKG
jgi:hypothetical protein